MKSAHSERCRASPGPGAKSVALPISQPPLKTQQSARFTYDLPQRQLRASSSLALQDRATPIYICPPMAFIRTISKWQTRHKQLRSLHRTHYGDYLPYSLIGRHIRAAWARVDHNMTSRSEHMAKGGMSSHQIASFWMTMMNTALAIDVVLIFMVYAWVNKHKPRLAAMF